MTDNQILRIPVEVLDTENKDKVGKLITDILNSTESSTTRTIMEDQLDKLNENSQP